MGLGTDYTGNDVHAENLLLLHWNGKSWKRLPAPPTGEWTQRVNQVRAWPGATSGSRLGQTDPEGTATRRSLILHWDGHTWTNSPAPYGPGELMDIASADGRMTAVGDTFSPSATSWGMYILRKTANGWQSEMVVDVCSCEPLEGDVVVRSPCTFPGAYGASFARRPAERHHVMSTRTLPTAPLSTARCASAVLSSGKRTSGRPCSSPTGRAPSPTAAATSSAAAARASEPAV
jgi:hypothetical protein